MKPTKKPALRRTRPWLKMSAVIVAIALGYWWMNQGYGALSKEGFDYGMALMSAANRQDSGSIQTIVERVQQDVKQNKLSSSDAEVLLKIARFAQLNDWQTAKIESRKLLDAQQGVAGTSKPPSS